MPTGFFLIVGQDLSWQIQFGIRCQDKSWPTFFPKVLYRDKLVATELRPSALSSRDSLKSSSVKPTFN